MALKYFNPVTPSTRQLVLVDKSVLWRGSPEKALVVGQSRTGGRNNNGRITTRHIGGGHKQQYRLIDFKRNKMDMPATVIRLEYDPNRTAFIALVEYTDGEKAYILAQQKMKDGDIIIASKDADIKIGNSLPLSSIPVGTIICNIEMKPGKGGQVARSAGTFAQLVGRDGDYAQVRLASGEVRLILAQCMATIGAMSNPDQKNTNLGKAGRSRWMGVRPTVRGVVMNPVDHPHGGGEGKTSGGRHPVSPWGLPTKGKKTRGKKPSDKFIMRRRTK